MMLANPASTLTQPLPPCQHHSEPDPSPVSDDPLQVLYNSLADLNLTTSDNTNTTNTGDPWQPAICTSTGPAAVNPSLDSQATTPNPSTTPQELIKVSPLFPPGDNVLFAHSSFFRRHKTWDLPTPTQVRLEAARLGIVAPTAASPEEGSPPHLVPFPALGLLVKYGTEDVVSAAEGKALILLRGVLSPEGSWLGEVVPEVFGWRADGRERFVYLSLSGGNGEGLTTLEERWAGMWDGEKREVSNQLREIVRAWRRMRQGTVGFVGSVDNTPLMDQVFRGCEKATGVKPGPFPSVAAFHVYLVRSGHISAGSMVRYMPYHIFPNEVPIVFTHGGLHPRNIIVSAGPYPRVVSILGWEQAGWYPAYWELCKARWESSSRGKLGDWEAEYLPRILDVEELRSEICGWSVGPLCQYWDYFVGLIHYSTA